jgi:aspartate racemase
MKKRTDRQKFDPVIGILGGMGPEATLDLYRHIIALTPAEKDQDHIKVVIYSNPKIPDRTDAICGDGESPLPQLLQAVDLLERAGAGVIAMPCNTAHHYISEMQAHTHIPIINMVEETAVVIRKDLPGIRSVGLLAMDGTIKSEVYRKAMEPLGIRILIPEDAGQKRIQIAIARVKAGKCDSVTREMFETAAEQLVQAGARAVILGCTEIPLAFDVDAIACICLNPARILAQCAVDWAFGVRSIP